MMNKFQCHCRAINCPIETGRRTREKIANIQSVGFDAGILTVQALSLRVSRKVHRLMRNASDDLLDFGCSRRGDTDCKETLKRENKASYWSKNKKAAQIAL